MHVAIIPDGNRRWARARGLRASQGYEHSANHEHVMSLFGRAKKLGVKVVSVWLFSTDNWKRPEQERESLFKLLRAEIETLSHEELCVRWVGRRDRVPADIKESLERLEQESKDKKDFTVVLCLDYGGRDELERAAKKSCEQGLPLNDCLDTSGLPDPDLIIRTSGEYRLSGFMPWQSAYAELFFVKEEFPDFTPAVLERVIKEFSSRHRRFGS